MLNPLKIRLPHMRYLMPLLLLCTNCVAAQSFIYPKLPSSAQSIETVIPTHWHALDTIYGDLNNDRREDLVLVLEFNEPINEPRAYGDAESEIIKEFQRPRMLAIYFKKSNRQYALALQNNHFILREKEGGSYGDPYQSLSVENNTLQLNFTGGSAWQWNLSYQFVYLQQDWVLTGATNRYFHRGTGELTEKTTIF